MMQLENHCSWCGGSGYLQLLGRGRIECLNCHGSGIGPDGGRKVTHRSSDWMIGNQHAKKEGRNNIIDER